MLRCSLSFPAFGLAALLALSVLAGAPSTAWCADVPAGQFSTRELSLDHRYLNIPVKAGACRRTLSVIVDGQVVRAFEVELAEGEPEFWAFTDLAAWLGRRATIRLDAIGRLASPESQKLSLSRPIMAQALERLRLTDEIANAESLYHETLRPRFHFTPRRGGLNDPNGLLYYHGEYHLFYQLQPFSMTSLNSDKSWGHAVSADLVHWAELPVAIYPDAAGGAWSGSTLVDVNNTAGFQTGAEPALLLFYTATGRSAMHPKSAETADFVQRLAYSNDRGRTWSQFAGNPVA